MAWWWSVSRTSPTAVEAHIGKSLLPLLPICWNQFRNYRVFLVSFYLFMHLFWGLYHQRRWLFNLLSSMLFSKDKEISRLLRLTLSKTSALRFCKPFLFLYFGFLFDFVFLFPTGCYRMNFIFYSFLIFLYSSHLLVGMCSESAWWLKWLWKLVGRCKWALDSFIIKKELLSAWSDKWFLLASVDLVHGHSVE